MEVVRWAVVEFLNCPKFTSRSSDYQLTYRYQTTDMANFQVIAVAILVLFLAVVDQSRGDFTEGTVYLKQGNFSFVSGQQDKDGAAYGFYNNTLFKNGWGVLDIKSGYGGKITNNDAMYAAGYLEGVLTARQIWQHFQNIHTAWFGGKDPSVEKKIRRFLDKQQTWMSDMISKHGDTDPLWRHVGYISAQYDGLYAGYKSVAESGWRVKPYVVQMLNAMGELIDLMYVVAPETRPDFSKMTPKQLQAYSASTGHCSALVKVTGAYEDVFMSHSSWFIYSSMLRIYKHYDFNVDDAATAAKKISFSSYPAFLESLDDFYVMSSQMVMLQTTNNVYNHTLYDLVKPQSLLAWQRVRVANMMAHGGEEWAKIIGTYNSGTYNNQYMVIDLKRIELRKSLHDGALWVVEQIPGTVEAGDQTQLLRLGYWPSYNVPFYERIFNASGYAQYVQTHSLDFSYQLAPRAKIFRRDQVNVTDLGSLKAIMRYNDYQHDKYSDDNPCSTICCRGDLDADNPRPDGCYDTKVTDYNMALKFQSQAVSGPTLGTGLKPFSWTGAFTNVSHIGLPPMYNFDWVQMEPTPHK